MASPMASHGGFLGGLSNGPRDDRNARIVKPVRGRPREAAAFNGDSGGSASALCALAFCPLLIGLPAGPTGGLGFEPRQTDPESVVISAQTSTQQALTSLTPARGQLEGKIDPDLAELGKLWGFLPPMVRKAMVSMAQASVHMPKQ